MHASCDLPALAHTCAVAHDEKSPPARHIALHIRARPDRNKNDAAETGLRPPQRRLTLLSNPRKDLCND